MTDLFFRPLFAFFVVELQSRKVIHVNVTRSLTDLWVAQQLREATPYGQAPKYLIRENDRKFGLNFARVATTSGIKVLRTPYRTPRANAIWERFLGSVRRACLDHFLIFQEKQLSRVLRAYITYFNQARPPVDPPGEAAQAACEIAYVAYFNRARPHQGIRQQLPESPGRPLSPDHDRGKVISFAVLGGLHHDYRKGA